MKFNGKYNMLVETAIERFQQYGFLNGDAVKFKPNCLKHKILANAAPQFIARIQSMMKDDKILNISCIKSGQSDWAGPVNSPNIPVAEPWADVIIQYAPGLWKDPITVPLAILSKVDKSEAEGYHHYPQSIVRKNNKSKEKAKKVDQTAGEDSERTLHNKNVTLPFTKSPKSGNGMKAVKESRIVGKPKSDGDLIFEAYTNSLLTK